MIFPRRLGLLSILGLAVAVPACGSNSDPPQSTTGVATADGTHGPRSHACDNTSALPVTLNAANLELTGVKAVAKGGEGGRGYVDDFDQPGSSVAFEFCVPSDGYYTMTYRYRNGSGNEATRTMTVDGLNVPGAIRFIARVDAHRWEPVAPSATPQKSVRLTAGKHVVSLLYGDDDRGSMSLESIALAAGPQPSLTSVSSVLMNNWGSLVAMHYAGIVYPQWTELTAPRLGELHWKGDWPTSQVQEATGFLRDDSVGMAYTYPCDQAQSGCAYTNFSRNPFQSNQSMGTDGVATVDYLSWGETPLPAGVTKQYALVPNENFLLVRYDLSNVTGADHAFSMLEFVHPNNKTLTPGSNSSGGSGGGSNGVAPSPMHATYRADLNAWVIDMSASNGTFLIAGALQAPSSFGAAVEPASSSSTTAQTTGGDHPLVDLFGTTGALNGVASQSAPDVEVGFVNQAKLSKSGTKELDFYYAVAADLPGVEAIAARVRSRSVTAWFKAQSSAWAGWLATGNAARTKDPILQSAYAHSLVGIRQVQQPQYGSFVASTNLPYGFKVWPRDSGATAMGLDAAGYLADAERYWLWMASVQEHGANAQFPDGTWWTNYDYWQPSTGIGFVSPEWDSLGIFIIGCYQHHRLLMAEDPALAQAFLAKVAPAIVGAASFIEGTVNAIKTNHGYGAQDFSIWEDIEEWAGFTQTTYASGLYAAKALAGEPGLDMPWRAAGWKAAARTIKHQLTRAYSLADCGGNWDPTTKSLYRGILPNCEPDTRTDASENLIAIFGLLAADDPKAVGMRKQTVALLQPQKEFDVEGITRFQNDDFYYSSIYSPGGLFEAKAPEPVWPQMSMYVAMGEHWTGDDVAALARLQWAVSVMGVGFASPGEAVDWTTQQMMVSTATEPVTASWFILGLLTYLDQYDTRLPLDP